jgi:hypothetical protein
MRKTTVRANRVSQLSALAFREVVKREADLKPPNFNSWFDLWHRHVDWNGDGKLSRLHRKFQLWALFRTLHKFERQTHHMRDRCQVFLLIHEHDPGSDAVYVHTENPNGTPFPCEPKVQIWLSKLPFWFSDRISLANYRVGLSLHDGDRHYFVQRKR